MVNTYEFQIDGPRTMHCRGCASSVEYALSQHPEVTQVSADFQTQRIVVETSAPVASEEIQTVLGELDYVIRERFDEN